MLNLIKTDIKRFTKDKCFIILFILIIGFAAISSGGYKLIEVLSNTTGNDADLGIDGFYLMLASLSPQNNMGFTIPILFSIVLLKDYTHGTIRNKIVSGHSKTSIYISSIIVMLIFSLSAYVLNGIINLLVGAAFFGFGSLSFHEVLKMFGYLLLLTLAYSTIISGITFLAHLTRSIGVTIVLAFVAIMVISIFGSLYSFRSLPDIVRNISKISPCYTVNSCIEKTVNSTDVAITFVSFIVNTLIFNGLGIYFINKHDIK